MKSIYLYMMALFFIFLSVVSQEINPFGGPDLETKIFDNEKIALTKEEKTEISTAIGCYVRDTQNIVSERGVSQATKMLGIALRLDEKNRDAVVINSKLKRGVKDPQAISQDKGLPVLIKILSKYAKKLNQLSGDPDKQLAAYLFELIVDLDPKNDDAVYELETMQPKIKCDWSWANKKLPETNQMQPKKDNGNAIETNSDEKVNHIKLNQSSVKGLIIFSMESGKKLGSTLDIIVTYVPMANKSEFKFDNNKKIGQEMVDSFKEAIGYFKTKYRYIDSGEYKVSFGDRYSDKDGGSAGTAFALIILSLFEGYKIDPKCAITGDISVDGKVRVVGGVLEKIQGAYIDKCSIVCIPTKNNAAFRDFIVLNGLAMIKEINVFSIQHVDDAKKIMAVEKDPVVLSAMNEFSEICKKINLPLPHLTLNKPEVIKQLEELKLKYPDYENVNLMIDLVNSKFEKTLSLMTSLERVFTAGDSFLPYLETTMKQKELITYQDIDENRQIVTRQKIVINESDIMRFMNRNEISVTLVKNKLEELNALKNLIDPKLRPINLDLIAFITSLDRFLDELERSNKLPKRVNPKGLYTFKQFESAREKLNKSLSNFKDDEKMIEKLIRN